MARRIDPNAIKSHRSYSAKDLADKLGVHKNSIRQWQRDGLQPNDNTRPYLFHADTVRAFLAKRSAKRHCPPGTIYCFRCRDARSPAGAMVDYVPKTPTRGNLSAICATCDTIMHRAASLASLATIMPGIDVQVSRAPSRLIGKPYPSLNCDSGPETVT